MKRMKAVTASEAVEQYDIDIPQLKVVTGELKEIKRYIRSICSVVQVIGALTILAAIGGCIIVMG